MLSSSKSSMIICWNLFHNNFCLILLSHAFFFFFVSNTLLPFFVRYIVLDSYKKTKRETIYIDIYHSFVTKNNLSATYIIMPLDSSLTAAVNKGQLKL